MVRCVTEQRDAASLTVTICVSAPQAAHHISNVLLSRVRRTVRLWVSTVIRVVRFAKAHHPFCAGGVAPLSNVPAHDRRDA